MTQNWFWGAILAMSTVFSLASGGDVSISLPVSVQSHLTISNSQQNLTSQMAAGRRHNAKTLLDSFKMLPMDEMAGTLMKILSEVGDTGIVEKVRE